METFAHPIEGIRFLTDIHGDAAGMAELLLDGMNKRLYTLVLGDLINYGADSVGCMEIALRAHADGWLDVVPGNHDLRFVEAWHNPLTQPRSPVLRKTLTEIDAHPQGPRLAEAYAQWIRSRPLWWRHGRFMAAHGGYIPGMLVVPPPLADTKWIKTPLHTVVLGRPPRGTSPYAWVDQVPVGMTMVVGHEIRASTPLVVPSAGGGRAIFLDTGSGKGGVLSYWDVPLTELGPTDTVSPALTLVFSPAFGGAPAWIDQHAQGQCVFNAAAVAKSPRILAAMAQTLYQQMLSGQRVTVLVGPASTHWDQTLLDWLLPSCPAKIVLIDQPWAVKARLGRKQRRVLDHDHACMLAHGPKILERAQALGHEVLDLRG